MADALQTDMDRPQSWNVLVYSNLTGSAHILALSSACYSLPSHPRPSFHVNQLVGARAWFSLFNTHPGSYDPQWVLEPSLFCPTASPSHTHADGCHILAQPCLPTASNLHASVGAVV